VLRVSYPGRWISVLYRDLDGLYFSGLGGSGKKQVVANSMHRKDYPYSLLRSLKHYKNVPFFTDGLRPRFQAWLYILKLPSSRAIISQVYLSRYWRGKNG